MSGRTKHAAELICEFGSGRHTPLLVPRLLRTQHALTADHRRRAESAMLQLMQHAQQQSPYYAGIVSRLGTQAAQEHIVTRDAVRRQSRRMIARHPTRRPLLCASRGTTDEGVPFYWDRTRQSWDRALRQRAHGWHGFAPGDRELHIWPVDPPLSRGARLRQTLRTWRDALVGDCLIDASEVLSDDWQRSVTTWCAFDPRRVTAYPSVLIHLIRQCRAATVNLFSNGLQAVFATGEILHDWQRREIESFFNVPVFAMYGVQEVGAIAFEDAHRDWRVSAEAVHMEYLRDGHAALPGELSEIVATALVSKTMPMIRYATGDVARCPAEPPPYAAGLPIMQPVLGRCGDFLVDANEQWILPQRLMETLAPTLLPGSYALHQSHQDRVELRSTIPIDTTTLAATHRSLSDLLGQDVCLTLRIVERLPRSSALKLRYVTSDLSRQSLAVRADSPAASEFATMTRREKVSPEGPLDRGQMRPWRDLRSGV